MMIALTFVGVLLLLVVGGQAALLAYAGILLAVAYVAAFTAVPVASTERRKAVQGAWA